MVTAGVAAGAEPLASEAIACIRSLHQNTSVDRIIAYVPESERAEIDPNKRDALDRLARVEYGPSPSMDIRSRPSWLDLSVRLSTTMIGISCLIPIPSY